MFHTETEFFSVQLHRREITNRQKTELTRPACQDENIAPGQEVTGGI